mmetsp:Transcript_78036/g.131082  ORF Transcript_78036/g.131082 Transcript_78036/m.131082 type:complete len:201 (+) Transcript_78036:667-1269(+)
MRIGNSEKMGMCHTLSNIRKPLRTGRGEKHSSQRRRRSSSSARRSGPSTSGAMHERNARDKKRMAARTTTTTASLRASPRARRCMCRHERHPKRRGYSSLIRSSRSCWYSHRALHCTTTAGSRRGCWCSRTRPAACQRTSCCTQFHWTQNWTRNGTKSRTPMLVPTSWRLGRHLATRPCAWLPWETTPADCMLWKGTRGG